MSLYASLIAEIRCIWVYEVSANNRPAGHSRPGRLSHIPSLASPQVSWKGGLRIARLPWRIGRPSNNKGLRVAERWGFWGVDVRARGRELLCWDGGDGDDGGSSFQSCRRYRLRIFDDCGHDRWTTATFSGLEHVQGSWKSLYTELQHAQWGARSWGNMEWYASLLYQSSMCMLKDQMRVPDQRLNAYYACSGEHENYLSCGRLNETNLGDSHPNAKANQS